MMKLVLTAIFILLSTPALAGKVTVTLQTPGQTLLEGAVVYLTPSSGVAPTSTPNAATMDQMNRQFSPHILAVQKDAPVSFPNSDSIKHHVYSFSPAKVFQLQVYKGSDADPIVFGKTGVVELGCNVHDWMLGYIYVVDTPYFTQTQDRNQVSLELPDGDYRLNVWHPRMREADQNRNIALALAGDTKVTFEVTEPLLPGHSDLEDEIDEFSTYE